MSIADVGQQRSHRANAFSSFLHNLGVPIYEDISKKVQIFLTKFKLLPPTCTVDMLSSTVQDFYQSISDHLSANALFQSKLLLR